MDPVSASENFLQQVGQKLVKALFGGKKTEEKKQESTEEDVEPNVSAQGVETTDEVGETPVDPSIESAVSVQENHDDAPSTSPPGPDISERFHLGQTEHSIPQESKTKSSDSSQPTAADEEVTERRHGQDDQSTQIAVVSAEPLESPDSRDLQDDAGAAKSDSLKQPNRSEHSAEELAPDVESEVLSCHDKVDWKENVQGEQLHTDSQELQNVPEDTTVQDSAAPTPIKAKFMDKTEIQMQMQAEDSSRGISVVEKLSKDKTVLTNRQESEELVCTTQSPGADSYESSLAADARTVNIPLPTSCSEQPAGVKDGEKLVTQTGQLPECDSDTVDLRDTDKTAVESGVSCASKDITTSHGTMSEEVQPRPSLGSSSEALPSLSLKHDILRQLYGKLMGNRVLVLLGEAGSGKTTAAILLAHSAPIWCEEFDSYLFDGDDGYLPETVTDFPSKSLIIIDNFLGRYDADSLSYWNTVVPLLESMKENADKQILLLLTSRTTIFQNVLSSEETDVRFFLDENHVTTVTIDYRRMWKDICEGVKVKTPDFQNLPSIGFPLCCQLAPHLAPDEQTILFQQPRLALHRMVRTLMDSTGIARTALTLLAVSEGSLDINIFTSLARLQESRCYEIMSFLPQAPYDEETSAQIIAFYKHSAFIFQVCNNAVSFRSEVIREAVLIVLCDSHAELLAKYCSLELLSQIALATSDKDTSGNVEKPALSDSAKSAFLRRLVEEMKNVSNFDAMFSPLFQHHSILSMFASTIKEESLLKQWTQKCSRSGLHFVFYAGAVPSVFRSSLSELDKRNLWVVLQAVLACCYWGYSNNISDLMKVLNKKPSLKKAMKGATIRDIVTGNLPGFSRREEPRWEMTPLFPEDTLLVLAARKGKDDVVKTLAYRDMNVNSQGMDGRTALMHYCARGRTDMVQFLLNRKAYPKIRDKWGMTALMYALQRKQWDIPKELMKIESYRVENIYLQSPLTFACAHKWSTPMIANLIKGADIMQKDKWGYTCLHYACLHGHSDIVAYLLKQKKVDVRGKSDFGHTPLTLAVTGPERSKLVKLLLNTEPTEDAEVIEVINMICRASDCSVMETLLSACLQKADVKRIALLLGSLYGNTEMVRYLLQSGADAGATYTADAYTALHYACNGFSVDCCEILLDKIDPNIQTTNGSTPLIFALQVGALDCARLLLRRGENMNSSTMLGSCLHHATLSNLCSVLDWCIKEHKMDVNSRNISGMTPLQVACKMGKYHSVKYLLDNGADILKADDNGDTCLHDAARSGHWDIVRLLEKVDPSLMNAPNKEGETPAQLLKNNSANIAESSC